MDIRTPLVGAHGILLGQSPMHSYSGLCENLIPKEVLQVKGAYPVLTETIQEDRAGVPPTRSPKKNHRGTKSYSDPFSVLPSLSF